MPDRNASAFRACVVIVLLACLIPASSAANPATKLYVGHAARLTARIPSGWQVEPKSQFDYAGSDGFVVSEPVLGQDLDEACSKLAESRFGSTATSAKSTLSGVPVCRLDGRVQDAEATALVIPHPHPFETFGEEYSYIGLISDPGHLDAIAATVSFSPELVTAEAYVASVLDIVEARSYWSSEVDWEVTRAEAMDAVEGLETLTFTQNALVGVLRKLQAAGDNHSFLVPPGPGNQLDDANGFGLLVGGNQVILVYPDSPAGRAGVQTGDLVEALNGRPYAATSDLIDPSYVWGSAADLTFSRPGDAGDRTVRLEQGPYSLYVPPAGRRLADDVGYLVIYGFTAFGQEVDYAAEARRVIAEIDRTPTCGWVIDLRLNTGGSYFPMVTGVGPILGNGTFVGWEYADGTQTWVTYDDGRIVDDGIEISDYLADREFVELHVSDPPVAVLTSPYTGSSGEVTTLAFVGRPDTRLFGEQTGGYTTANAGYSLFDGSFLGLAEAAMADRTGAVYPDGIKPDAPVDIDWTQFATNDDPVLNAATEWVTQQSACAGVELSPAA